MLNNTKINKIKNPYIKASLFPFALSLLPFVKNETVNGIIGKTHGVKSAISPPKNPRAKINQLLSPPVFS